MKKVILTLICCTLAFVLFSCDEQSSETPDESQHIHTVVTDVAVAPTCTETGLTEGKHCSVCNDIIVAQTVVAKLNHDEENHEAKEPTCTEGGWDAYVTCKRTG